MKRFFSLFIILSFVFILPSFGEDITLTLDDAISLALRDNRDVLMNGNEIQKAQAQVRQAWSQALPSFSVDVDRDRTSNLAEKPYTTTVIHAGLVQSIFQSGRVYNSIKQSEYNKEVKEALFARGKIETVLTVKKAFCTLVLSQYFLDLNKNVVNNKKWHLVFTKARYKKGEVPQLEVDNATSSLDSAKKIYEISVSQVEAAKQMLRNLLYLDNSVNIKTEAEFAYDHKEIMFDKALLNALSNRPEIKQYEAQENADQHALNKVKAGNLPGLYLTMDSYSGDRFITTTGATNKWKNYNVFGVTLEWPVFDGFATKAKIEQAMADLKQTQLLKEKNVQDIALELRNSYLALKNSISSLDSAESDIKFYKNNLISVKEKYKDGIASSLDLDDADLKYKLSVFNKEQALYDCILARSSLDKAQGGI